jgi:hypothetical protein
VRKRPVNEERASKSGRREKSEAKNAFLGFTPAGTRAEKGTAKCTMDSIALFP